mmetsp:Transcript_55524/g.92316  ORF Transcript_55524/g.92316 Transcript_55524/m.92316 type:complete len:344 (-) Transcript_55524:72-1103(-)|eukprot:CAMPEP_0202695378 /NCGR_PEP_ID=MMETSP1385-20130828/8986_1 /ASSEMBLY_ACC=CAM_ASM_000861 /TAXON_ID=933848 /ORGANISM="Elphidium margaritaceum" /LENGTH=343 /DNA_ID=CAMNT_0049351393 /DNA_START=26 /DNA_END=1057 /DNA_ORIENTATION=-
MSSDLMDTTDFDFADIAEAFNPDKKVTLVDPSFQLQKHEAKTLNKISGQCPEEPSSTAATLPLKSEPKSVSKCVSKSQSKSKNKSTIIQSQGKGVSQATTTRTSKPAIKSDIATVDKKRAQDTPGAAVSASVSTTVPPSQRDLSAVTAMLDRLQERSTQSQQRLHEVVLSKHYKRDIFGRQNTDECITITCPWCGELKGYRYFSKHLFAKCASRHRFLNESALLSTTRSTRSTRNKNVNYALPLHHAHAHATIAGGDNTMAEETVHGTRIRSEEEDEDEDDDEEEFDVELIVDDEESEDEAIIPQKNTTVVHATSVKRKRKSYSQQHWDDEYTPSKRQRKRNQ